MFDQLIGLGYGLVVFAIIIGVGSVILVRFSGATATCGTDFAYDSTSELCVNSSNASQTATPTGDAYTNTAYLTGQLGSSGLAGWTPAIIAISVGLLFLGAFMINKGGKRR